MTIDDKRIIKDYLHDAVSKTLTSISNNHYAEYEQIEELMEDMLLFSSNIDGMTFDEINDGLTEICCEYSDMDVVIFSQIEWILDFFNDSLWWVSTEFHEVIHELI